MIWKARIEALVALHHIIAREIERRKIFYDNNDHNNFLERLGNILIYNKTSFFACALIREGEK
jgi:putative transposase